MDMNSIDTLRSLAQDVRDLGDGCGGVPTLGLLLWRVGRTTMRAGRSAGLADEEDHLAPLVRDSDGSVAEEAIARRVSWRTGRSRILVFRHGSSFNTSRTHCVDGFPIGRVSNTESTGPGTTTPLGRSLRIRLCCLTPARAEQYSGAGLKPSGRTGIARTAAQRRGRDPEVGSR